MGPPHGGLGSLCLDDWPPVRNRRAPARLPRGAVGLAQRSVSATRAPRHIGAATVVAVLTRRALRARAPRDLRSALAATQLRLAIHDISACPRNHVLALGDLD